jgi:RimJ/RimL family protein N-acetyltransferase
VPRLPAVLPAGEVTLCRWRVADAADAVAAIEASIDDLRLWMDWAVDGVPSESTQREAFQLGEAAFEDGTGFGYVLREIATGDMVGGCALLPRVGPGAIEIGYWVRSDRHSRGYATASARALTAAAFEWLPEVQIVEIHVDEGNTVSQRVPAKLGYQIDRREQRERVAPGQTGTCVIWAMRRPDWELKVQAQPQLS